MQLRVGLVAGFIACAGLGSGVVTAQRYPVKPVRILIGFSPGGGADTVARILAQKLTEALIGKAVASAEMQDALAKQGLEPRTSTPEESRRSSAGKFRSADLIKATGAKAD